MHDHPPAPPVRPAELAGLFVCGVASAAALGGFLNGINASIDAGYFVKVLRWRNVADPWRAAVAQGAFEGALFGTVFSLMLCAGLAVLTRAGAGFAFGARCLAACLAGAVAGWALGGALGAGIARLSPEWFAQTFSVLFDGPPEPIAAAARAWVGGSIWGLVLGGFAATVLTLTTARGAWLRRRAETCG